MRDTEGDRELARESVNKRRKWNKIRDWETQLVKEERQR